MLTAYKWFLLLLPGLLWVALRRYNELWWVDNIVSIPSIILLTYLTCTIILLFYRQWIIGAASFVITLCPVPLLVTSEIHQARQCDGKLKIIQFNIFYENPDINQLINYLMQNPADLVIMQELSPNVGDKLHSLDDLYPFYFGGQQNLGYPSNQMILSKYPLEPVTIYHTPDGQEVVRALWQVNEGEAITLMTAHPPSPRNENLWQRRNALIRTIEMLTERYPSEEMLVVGDFNISAASPGFSELFEHFQSMPVATWPTSIKGLPIPEFTMIGIDHLWLKSTSMLRQICHRQSMSEPDGSDHRLVETVVGY